MPLPNCSFRKRQPISLDEKKAIIEEARTKSVPEVAVHFNRKYPESTIRTILKDKDKILKAVEEGAESKRARIRTAKHSDLDEALLRWFKDVRSQNIPVDTHTLKAKAVELARMLDIGDFNASEGWASRFKSRHGIVFKQVQGEAGDVDMEAVSDWHQTVLYKELEQFSEENVFNVDETGLFWRLLPSKTLSFKGDRCTSGKRSKERITVLVGSNMSGTEKVPLLVIGKSRSPRCFKNARVPVDYEANQKAWMTAEIFERWIKKWDRKLGKENRKILLFVDNCPAHPKITLTNIALRFFLPNATAEVQPMDQGVIQNLKIHYRRLLLRRRIASIDSSAEFNFDLLSAINLLDQAWSEVKPETLKNCFRKASFFINDEGASQIFKEAEVRLEPLWQQLQHYGEVERTISLTDFLNADEALTTSGALSLEEIVTSCSTLPYANELDEEEPDEVDVPTPEPISRQTAYKSFDKLRQYVEHNAKDPEVIRSCRKLEDFLYQEQQKKSVQTQITQFFS